MIRKIFTDFPKRKFKLMMNGKRLIRLLGYLREVFWFVEIKFYSAQEVLY